MIKYILRELKTAYKTKTAKVMAISVVAICLIANLAVMAFTLIYGSDIDGVLGSNVLAFASWCFPIPYLATIFFADMVFGTYPDPHIKDSVTKNMSRTAVYLSELSAGLIVSLSYMILAFVTLLVTTRIFHSDITSYDVSLFVENMSVSILLWVAGVSFGFMFLFMFESKKKAYVAFFILTLVIPRFIMFFAAEPFSLAPFIMVRKILISQSFGHIPYIADPERSVPFIIGQGIVYTVLSSVIGIVAYNKRERKG
ncbi:MAG: hypothetical protein Q4E51_10265 [Lachnospiraceae bacterium]|nr:hypothetical protein [Lachnospiraceae bacterium]MDO4967074.1 hypothetical protein [Lachnospiraceae bacterium]